MQLTSRPMNLLCQWLLRLRQQSARRNDFGARNCNVIAATKWKFIACSYATSDTGREQFLKYIGLAIQKMYAQMQTTT